jgi:hypothetical protein
MQLQLIYSVSVPQRIQPLRNFSGLMNSRRMILNEIRCGLDKSIKELEHKTGISLAYYWKIAEKEKQVTTKGILFHI